MKSLRKVYGFMDNVKNDTYFANKIRDDLIFIVNYTKKLLKTIKTDKGSNNG